MGLRAGKPDAMAGPPGNRRLPAEHAIADCADITEDDGEGPVSAPPEPQVDLAVPSTPRAKRDGARVDTTVPYFLASRIRLNGVSAARRKRVNPASLNTSRRRGSPACAPSASPTSWDSELGVQIMLEAA